MTTDSRDRAAAYWNERHVSGGELGENYLEHPLVAAYISLRAFGNVTPHIDVVVAEIRSKTSPGARVFSPGCGDGLKELTLARLLPDRHFVASDIAVDALDQGREAASAANLNNIEFVRGDFNQVELEPRSFDAVCGMGAFHHIEALEHFWAACRTALRPGGVIMGQEYIGPNRFQWTEEQIESGTRVLRDVVPQAHQVHHREIIPPTVEHMLATDPSEAVRSAELLATLGAAGFQVHGYASGGSALLQPVLMHQIHTFDPRNWQHNLVLARLFDEEDRLMREGRLEDDFCMFVTEPLG